jgi:hypothetical protein
MTEELKLITELMNEDLTIETLRKIKTMAEKKMNKDYVYEILETDCIEEPARFAPMFKTVMVNYRNMLIELKKIEEEIKYSIRNPKTRDIKMAKLVKAYRIFLHEFHHTKQIYKAIEEASDDIESEIIRGIYNISEEELNSEYIYDILDQKMKPVNIVLKPNAQFNPIERKADIESRRQIDEIFKPSKNLYPKVYDNIRMEQLGDLTFGYNRIEPYEVPGDDKENPYEKTIDILKYYRLEYRLPYNSKNMEELKSKIAGISDQEKMELGLPVPRTMVKEKQKELEKMYKKYHTK